MRKTMFRQPQRLGHEDVLASITEAHVEAVALRTDGLGSADQTVDVVVRAERDVVGALLKDNSAYDLVVDVLRHTDFSDPGCALVFQAVADVVEGRNKSFHIADTVSVASLPGIAKLASLAQLQEWSSGASVEESVLLTRASMVKNAAGERTLGLAVTKIQGIAAEDRSLESKSEDILGLLSSAAEVRSLPVASLGDAAIEAITDLAERAQSGDTRIRIPYGFRDLDALTGGMHGGQLIVLAARPGVGKTACAMSMALNASAAGVAVLMASMEMKKKELSKRALSVISGVDSHAIRMGALNEDQWMLLADGAEKLQQLPFDVVDLPTVDVPGLGGVSRRRHRQGKLGLIIVDYLQIMKTSGTKGMNREQQIGEISRGLKELAMALDVPVLALSQLNRTVETRLVKRPQLSDLRESGAIEQDADVVIFIHRETGAAANQIDYGPAEIIVEKQRDGSPGETQVCFIRRTTAFADYDALPNAASAPLLQAA